MPLDHPVSFFCWSSARPDRRPPTQLSDRHGLASLGSFLAFGEGICGKKKERGAPSLSKLLLFPCAVIGASACTARPFCQLKVNNSLRLFLAQNTSG
ncbi:hypothetical protein K3X41_09325 [Aliiroseovarius crassostreae]|uniref:hypothetical protein n=1 Tax=Aliiroseovarius crassostreae TaxID=154981 RepID=UPI0021FE0001|nr:hypothetical protein [Aliiroseovarius crassostreae]UWQ10136.1 hypothetical protein K3X41_09325 [Aliiroseovarius crassostreae]